MEFYSNRQMSIFVALLEHGIDQPVTSEKLSLIARTSIRTVKDEIQVLKQIVKEDGIEIHSRPGAGYYLTCKDREHFTQIKNYWSMKYRSAGMVPTDFEQRVSYMIRRLLSADGYTKTDDLADALFITKRALSGELKEAYAQLAEYSIAVESKPGYGIRLEMDEYHFRICVVDYFEFYYHKIRPSFRAVNFLGLFDFKDEDRLAVRRILMQKLTELNDITFPDFCAQKMAIYLLLIKARLNRRDFVKLPDQELAQIRQFPEYGLSVQILQDLGETYREYCLADESEICCLTVLLATGKDSFSKGSHAGSYTGFYEEAFQLLGQIGGLLRDEYGICTEDKKEFQDDMTDILVSISMKARYDIKEITGSPTMINHIGRSILQSPVTVAVALRLVWTVEQFLGKKVSEYDMLNIGYAVYSLLESMDLEHRKVNLILISENTKFTMRLMEKNLKRYFGDFIGRIHILEVYELRKQCLEEYDAALSVHSISNFTFPVPLYKISYFMKKEDFVQIVRDILLKKQTWGKDCWDRWPSGCYPCCSVDSVEVFFKMLAYKYWERPAEGERFFSFFKKYARQFKLHAYSRVLVICDFFTPGVPKRAGFFEFDKQLMWNNSLIKYAVFFQGSPRDIQEMKLLEMILRFLEYDTRYVEAIVNSPEDGGYELLLEECIFSLD